MDDAIDNLTNLRIEAYHAERGDFADHYRCPECQKAVIFAGGEDTYQRAHFRHRIGNDNLLCNRYFGGGTPPPFYERDSVARAYSMVCGADSQQRMFFGIRLLLSVPAKEIAIVQSGKPTRQHVTDARPIAWITHSQARYQLTVGFGNGSTRHVEVEGFNSEKHIFQATGQLGVLSSRNCHLRRGDYYILLKGEDLSLPTGFNLQRRTLRNAENFIGWSIFSFTIPSSISDGARSWFTGATGYVLGRDSFKCALLQPDSAYSLENDSWQIEADQNWSLLVKFPPGHPDEVDIYVQRRTENLEYTACETRFNINRTNGYVFIGGSAEEATEGTVYRIAMRGNGGLALMAELSCVVGVQEPQCDRLGFIIDNKRLLWSSNALSRNLQQVREGKGQLIKIEVPAGLRLRARADGHEREIASVRDLSAFMITTKGALTLHVEGHGGHCDGKLVIKGVVIRMFTPINNHASSHMSQVDGPLADAFMRGLVSEYAASVPTNGNH